MARGPAPKSEALKRARGNPGKRKLSADKPAAALPAGDVKPSGKLKVAGRHVWNALAPELARQNVIRATDAGALSRYCDDVATYWEVTERLRLEGLTYEVKSLHGEYKRIHPLVAVQGRLAARLVSLEDRFGLSPQSRQQLMVRAAQLVSQGNLFSGGQAEAPAAAAPQPSNPVGLLGTPPGSSAQH